MTSIDQVQGPVSQGIRIGGKPVVGTYRTWLPNGYYDISITIPANRMFVSLFFVPIDVLFSQVSYTCNSMAPPATVSGIWIGVYDYNGVLLFRGHGSAFIPPPPTRIVYSLAISGRLPQGMYYAAACSDGTDADDPSIYCLGQMEVHALAEDAGATLKKYTGELALVPPGVLPDSFDPTLLTYVWQSIGPALRFDL